MTDNTAGVGPVQHTVRPLVERLRATELQSWKLDCEAADEIERLQSLVQKCGGDNCMGWRASGVTQWVTADSVEALRAALQEADTIMGHDDSATEWREKWAHLWALRA